MAPCCKFLVRYRPHLELRFTCTICRQNGLPGHVKSAIKPCPVCTQCPRCSQRAPANLGGAAPTTIPAVPPSTATPANPGGIATLPALSPTAMTPASPEGTAPTTVPASSPIAMASERPRVSAQQLLIQVQPPDVSLSIQIHHSQIYIYIISIPTILTLYRLMV